MSPDKRSKKPRGRRARKAKPQADERARREPAAVPPYEVLWHPDAAAERLAVQDMRDRTAIQHAVQKLISEGSRLPYPHQSAVKGKHGKGLRELRPRAGRSPWRALYRQVGDRFVILAIGPEALVDHRGFNDAVARAQSRFGELEA